MSATQQSLDMLRVASAAADAKGGAKAADEDGARQLTSLEKEELEALQCFAMGDVDFDNMSEEEVRPRSSCAAL